MLRLPLSEFLGQCPADVRRSYRSRSRKFKVMDVVESANVPLLIQENRIRKERNPRRREALERQHNRLKRVSAPLPVHRVIFTNTNPVYDPHPDLLTSLALQFCPQHLLYNIKISF